MGASPDAELFFGVFFLDSDPRWPEGKYGREEPEDWDEDEEGEDWDTWLIKKVGDVDLEDPYDDPIAADRPGYTWGEEEARDAWDEAHPEWIAKRDAYWAAKRKIVEECPVKLITVGYYDEPSYALIINGAYISQSWGEAKRLDPDELAELASPEKRLAAWDFCQQHGLPWENPGWLLTASYG